MTDFPKFDDEYVDRLEVSVTSRNFKIFLEISGDFWKFPENSGNFQKFL